MSGGMPELGSKISLISKADIRYEGRLYTVDPQECTIALSSVRSFGTEDRDTQFQIAPQSQIYDYILFRGSDIKDIRVINNQMQHPNDPAIMQVQIQNGQQIMPHFPMPNLNPPAPQLVPGGYPFGGIGSGLGGIGGNSSGAGSSAAVGSMAPGAGAPGTPFMLGNQQQQQQQQSKPQQSQHKQPNAQQDQNLTKDETKNPTLLLETTKPTGTLTTTTITTTNSKNNGSKGVISKNNNNVNNSNIAVGAGRLFSEIVGGVNVGVGSGGGGVGVSGSVTGTTSLANDIRSVIGPTTSSSASAKKLLSSNAVALSENKDQDMLAGGGSRSTTPISLISRKSPSAEMSVQGNQQQQQHQNHNQHASNQSNAPNAGGGAGGHGQAGGINNKRQNQQQLHQRGGNNQQQRSNDFYHHHHQQQQRDRRDSGRIQDNQQQQHHEMRNNYNNQQRNNNNQGGGVGGGGPNNNRNWNMHRGGPNIPNMMRNRGGLNRGRMVNQGYRQMSGPGGVLNQNKQRNNKNTIKFEQDFDFEQANNKFEELRSQLAKLKVGEEPKSSEQMNGETDKKDDSGNETGAGDHEHEDDEITVGYDKTKSFFDNISCEAAQDRTKNKKNDWRQERKLNSETFGVSSTRRGSYRGRNNYYNRNIGNYNGGGNRGYRPGMNYRSRNNNNNNRNAMGGGVSRENNSGDANGNATNNNNNSGRTPTTTKTQPQAAGSAPVGTGSNSNTGATSKSTPQQANNTNNTPQLAAGGQ